MLFLSNGPGDPELLQDAVSQVKACLGKIPVCGICLGHQIITWALGGRTKKMAYGHHGGNHPVKDLDTGKTFVTSQNHGFMSDMESLPKSVLMLAGIRDILIISTPDDLPGFKRLLGDGSNYGVNFEYAEQPSPDGLAQAFIIGEKFIGNDSACLVLGDNIFNGNGFTSLLKKAVEDAEQNDKATVFGYWVADPERYGVAEFDADGNCLSIEEKPAKPKSNYAVVGLYFYPNKVVEVAKNIKPSARGELEITTVNQEFLKAGNLKVQTLGRGFAWLDTGTHDSLAEASTYIEVIEKRQGLKVACLEGIAYRKGWISEEKLREIAQPMLKNQYGQYLLNVIEEIKRKGNPKNV